MLENVIENALLAKMLPQSGSSAPAILVHPTSAGAPIVFKSVKF